MSMLRTDQLQTLDGTVTVNVKDLLTEGSITLDNILYTPPFTGSVTRSQYLKNTDKYSLFDAGGVGDGVADDTAAINTFLAANDNVLILPRGTWKISQSISVAAIVFEDGAGLTASSGVTLTTSSIQGPQAQLFYGSLLVSYKGMGLAEWFGAVGDGTTDDLSALTKAYTACSGLQLLGKTYATSGMFEIKKPFLLKGLSPEVTTIASTNGAADVVAVTSVNGIVGDDNASVRLEGFSVKYTGTSAPTAGAGINVTYCSYASVENIKIKNTYNGLYHNTALGCLFSGLTILGVYNNAIYAVTGAIDYVIRDVIIDGQTAYGSGVRRTANGVLIYGAGNEGWILDSIRCTMCVRAILIDSTASNQRNCPSFGRIDKCYFDTSSNISSFAKAREISVSHCWFSSNVSDSGLSLDLTHGITFSQCQFLNNAQHGIIIGNNSNFTVLNNCQLSSNSASSTSGAGVLVLANTNNFTITSCLIDNGSLSTTQRWGVFITAGTSTNYIVAMNQCYGNITGGVSDGGTGSQKYVANNFT